MSGGFSRPSAHELCLHRRRTTLSAKPAYSPTERSAYALLTLRLWSALAQLE